MQFVQLSDVLKEMEKGNPFNISFYTANRSKGSGGEKIEVEAVHHHSALKKEKKEGMQTMVESTETRTPHHFDNGTRNIRILASGQIRKLHIRLITEFNKKKVIW